MSAEILTQAVCHHEAGRLEKAEALYREVLKLEPDQPDALHLLGVLAHQKGDHDAAVVAIERAIAIAPEVAAYHGNLATALRALGRTEEAIRHFEKAVAQEPGLAPHHYNLAIALKAAKRPEEALPCFEKALALKSDHLEARFAYGNALREMGRPEKARRQYKKALFYDPKFAEAHRALGELAYEQAEWEQALSHFERALSLDTPFPAAVLIGITWVFSFLSSNAYQPNVENLLLKCFASPDVGHQRLALLSAEQIRFKYPHIFDGEAKDPGDAEAFLEDPLLRALLAKTINVDAALERPLTRLRRWFFLAGDVPAQALSFLAALAEQGLNNEYAFLVSPEEEAKLAALKTELESDLAPATDLTATDLDETLCRKLLLFSLYAPLHRLAEPDKLKGVSLDSWPSYLQPIVRRTLLDWFEEAAIKAKLPALTPIADATSRAVRSQYEENPYPRWFSADRQRRGVLPANLKSAAANFASADGSAEPDEILIAGCGSGQQAILRALMHPQVQITAVDLSRASLAYGVRMARRLGIENIDFLQADLLKLDVLKKQFPLIECGGVLHHLADPVAGWSVLTGLLRPGGWMFIGLYSEMARKDIVEARKWIAELGLKPTPEDMRALRKRLFFDAGDKDLPNVETFKRGNDLFDLNGCRDLLFHVQEHRFTLPQIGEILDRLGLRFAGFHLEDPSIRLTYGRQYPEDSEMTNLDNWDRFETTFPSAFVNMYQFWCEKPASA